MKGLEHAVNIKLWPGNGTPAKPWGRLKQDPELWDERGDTLVFFARGRPEPSFRIQSSLLRETESEVMTDMLLTSTVRSGTPGTPPGVCYKLYMDPPASAPKLDILRHHVTTRNFFAFLYGKPLVGFTFYQALADLHDRIEEYLTPVIDAAEALKTYLVTHGLVNVSNEPRAAAGLLVWSEDVRWDDGWREAFVHSVGMWEQLNLLQESADISLATKAHLDRAFLDLQARIHESQDVLSAFYFDEAQISQRDLSKDVRAASERFRKFLKRFYEKEYQNWPIKSKLANGLWLDRQIIGRLEHDFDSLYEYCVNRDVAMEQRPLEDDTGRSEPVFRSKTSESFESDPEDDRMLRIFRTFDSRHGNLNIPHPYPMLPESLSAPASKKSVFGGKKQDKARKSKIAYAYAVANNSSQIAREFAENALLKAFIHFEKVEEPNGWDPRVSRRECWITIYCVLQTLANIAVDVPYLSFKTGVNYFLNTRLENVPPWSPEEKIFEEAALTLSHCWTYPPTWADTRYERPDRRLSSYRAGSYTSSGRRREDDRPGTGGYDSESRPLSPQSPQSLRSFDFPLPPPYSGFQNRTDNNTGGPSSSIASYCPLGPESVSVPSLTEGSSGTDPNSRPDHNNSSSTSVVGGNVSGAARPSLFPPKFAALSGLAEYTDQPPPPMRLARQPTKSPSDRPRAGMSMSMSTIARRPKT